MKEANGSAKWSRQKQLNIERVMYRSVHNLGGTAVNRPIFQVENRAIFFYPGLFERIDYYDRKKGNFNW